MSVMRIVYVSCDRCGEAVDTEPTDTAASSRKDARADGWKVSLPGGRDLCPDCAAETP